MNPIWGQKSVVIYGCIWVYKRPWQHSSDISNQNGSGLDVPVVAMCLCFEATSLGRNCRFTVWFCNDNLGSVHTLQVVHVLKNPV